MAYDEKLAKLAFDTARQAGANEQVIISLFEAAIVESGFQNLNHGDRDSVGYLQQRPSQGWPNPMDPVTATKSFVSRALAALKSNPDVILQRGGLAQAVQRSGLPDKYPKAYPDAVLLLKKIYPNWGTGLGEAIAHPGDAAVAGADAAADALAPGLVAAVRGIANGLKSAAEALDPVGKFAGTATKLFLPTNVMRAVVGLMGIVFIFIGIAQLGRQVVR